jgi:5-methyltetrahydropteroyltriglutamate--homocysteine methyltransferase
VAAGFVLQIDDPGLPDWWDMLKPEPSVEAYRQFARRRIDAVNHALAGIPEESCAIICAGAAGMGRTPTICRSNTSSI